MLAHFFAFSNKIPSYDDLNYIFTKGFTSSSGRWGLELTSYIFPDLSMPWIYGVLSLIIISISACLMVRIFQIRSKLFQALIAGSITAFPSLTATVIYMFTLAPYALSFLLSVLSVQLVQKNSKSGFGAALLCMVFSLGIYQAYISVTASLFILLLIQNLLHGKELLPTFWQGIRYLAFLILSLGFYYLITKGINFFSGIQLNEYADSRICFSISYIPTAIYEAYRSFYLFFVADVSGLVPGLLSRIIHIGCCLAVIVIMLIWFFSHKKTDWLRGLFLACLLLLLPLAINALYFFIEPGPKTLHTLVFYSYISLYLFAAIVVDGCLLPIPSSKYCYTFSRISANLVVFGLVIVISLNVYAANSAYLKLHLHYENSYSFFTSLLSDLKNQPEFDGNTPVAICGDYPEPYFYWDSFSNVSSIMGTSGIQPGHGYLYSFLQYYIGLRNIPPIASQSQIDRIIATNEYANMACYPYYNSIKMIDNVLVVKLS